MPPTLFSSRSPVLWAATASSGLLLGLVLSSCSSASSGTAPAAAPAAPAVAAAPAVPQPFSFPAVSRKPSDYELIELLPIMNRALRGGRNYERGKTIFETHACPFCHRFGEGPGGIGPDISGVGGRMGVDGLLTEILRPSENVSDLFGKKIVTKKDGETVVGRRMENDTNGVLLVLNYTLDPSTNTFTWVGGNEVRIKPEDIVSVEDAEHDSPMPPGLIDDLKEEEVADLLAFLISGGNPNHRMFQPVTPPAAPPAAR
jgi:putative heme-binding domain-containing protein